MLAGVRLLGCGCVGEGLVWVFVWVFVRVLLFMFVWVCGCVGEGVLVKVCW